VAEVAVLGTGRMGAAMAHRVADAGHRLTVWNRSPAAALAVAHALPHAAVDVARTAADAVRDREVVLSVLADGAVTCAVLLDSDVSNAWSRDVVVCDLATSGVAAALALADGLATHGVPVVDAPVSGSVPAVEAGTLLVMAGGDPSAISLVTPVLSAFARRVVRVGSAGAGQAMKLAVNLVVHDLNAALAEALVLAENAGITREAAYDVLADSVVAAPYVAYKRAAFLDPATPVAMSLDLVRKDLRLVGELAASVAVPTAVTDAAAAMVDAACEAGHGAEDMAALSRFLRVRGSF
jgi:3-hydroxyisobutyrate dehydrogenase-like beta-hydroxyacid dehydrogenase